MAYRSPSPQKKPFIVGEERFLVTKVTQKSQNTFTGPQRYEASKLQPIPCPVRIHKPRVGQKPSICMTMIGGSVVYAPAFESAKERKHITNVFKDRDFLPRASGINMLLAKKTAR